MNYAVKLKSLNATKKTYEESNSRSKLTSLSHGNYSSRNPRAAVLGNEKKQVKLVCAFHSEQRITNFCRSKGCLLPLCPKCVTIHTQEHIKLGVYGEFTTIEDEIIESQKQIRLSLRKISDLETTIIKKKQEFQAEIKAGNETIKNGRIQIHEKVDEIFDILENAWGEQLSLINQTLLEQIEHVQEYLPSLGELANVGLMKLKNSQYVLEAVITNFSFFEQIQKLESEQGKISRQGVEKIDVQIQEGYLGLLVDFLSKYITWGKYSQDVWRYIQSIYHESGERTLARPNTSLRKMVASSKRENSQQKEDIQNVRISCLDEKSQKAEKGLTLNLSLDNFKSPLQGFSLEDLRKNTNFQP